MRSNWTTQRNINKCALFFSRHLSSSFILLPSSSSLLFFSVLVCTSADKRPLSLSLSFSTLSSLLFSFPNVSLCVSCVLCYEMFVHNRSSYLTHIYQFVSLVNTSTSFLSVSASLLFLLRNQLSGSAINIFKAREGHCAHCSGLETKRHASLYPLSLSLSLTRFFPSSDLNTNPPPRSLLARTRLV